MQKFGEVAKAVAGGIVGIAAFIIGSGGADVTNIMWWAGGVIFLGAGYGIVWVTPNRATVS